MQQQGCDNGDINQTPENYWLDYWASIFSRGTVNAKNCVIESFVLDKSEANNTNYYQFLDTEEGSTYQNVHCIGSSPLSLYNVNRGHSIKVAVTQKEMQELDGRNYGDLIPYDQDLVAWTKYRSVMIATSATYVEFAEAVAGVEKHDTVSAFNKTMKNDSTAVNAFMQTGCWNFNESSGSLTWKKL